MSIKKIGAVFIRVKNLDKSLPFYSDILGLQLRNIEKWDQGRGANYIIPDSPLLTLIEDGNIQVQKNPYFNLNCSNVLEMHERFNKKGIRTSQMNEWSSESNLHIDF